MITMIKKIGLAGSLLLASTVVAQAATAVSLDELLQQVKTGRVADRSDHR